MFRLQSSINFKFFCVFDLLITTLISSSVSFVHPKHPVHDKSWDILIFTQHWPPTICKLWMEKKPHTCAMPSNQDTWTIHGIWPTKIGTMGPFFCNKTWLFDPEEVKPIETQLEQSWINIEAGKYSYYVFLSLHLVCVVLMY